MSYLERINRASIVVSIILMPSLLFSTIASGGKLIDSMIWETYYKIATSLAEHGKHDEAISYFTKVIDINPKSIYAYQLRGASYYETGRFKEAISDFNKSLELNPNSPVDYYTRALAWLQLKEKTNALDDYSKAIDLAPDKLFLRIARRNLCQKLWNFKCAIQDMTKAIELDPENAGDYYNMRGHAHYGDGNAEIAISDYLKAIELGAEDASTYLHLGQCWENQDLEQARNYYLKSLEIDPGSFFGHFMLGRVYTQQNKIELALKHIDIAIEKDRELFKAMGMRDDRWEIIKKNMAYWPLAAKFDLEYLEGYEPSE